MTSEFQEFLQHPDGGYKGLKSARQECNQHLECRVVGPTTLMGYPFSLRNLIISISDHQTGYVGAAHLPVTKQLCEDMKTYRTYIRLETLTPEFALWTRFHKASSFSKGIEQKIQQ